MRGLRRHVVWFLVGLAYLVVWPYFERMNNPNENVRVYMTRAIVEHGRLNIDAESARWGWVDDKAKSDTKADPKTDAKSNTGNDKKAGGHIYSSKAPGVSFLGVPVFAAEALLWHALGWPAPSKRAATLALRLGAVALPSIAFLFLLARFVERRTSSAAARDLVVVGVGLGTMLYPYGILFVGHASAAMLGFAAYIAMATGMPRARPDAAAAAAAAADDVALAPARVAAAGALAAAAVMFEYQMLLAAIALGVYAAVAFRRRAAWFVVGALPIAIALGAYHTALFGRPWEFPYGHLENQVYAQVHHGSGFFGLAGPHLTALGTSLFSVSYGLFAFSPFLALGLGLAIATLRRRPRRDGVLVLAVAAALALFLSGMTHWRGGWCVGPRYIAGVAPFLALGLVLGWRALDDGSRRAEILRALAGGLVVASIFGNGISAAVYPHYPEQFDNPIFDLALPLLADGYVPYGLGWALGLPRAWSLLPVAALWTAAAAIAIGGGAGTWRRALARIGAALVVAALFVVPLSRYGRAPTASEAAATATVRRLWEPTPKR